MWLEAGAPLQSNLVTKIGCLSIPDASVDMWPPNETTTNIDSTKTQTFLPTPILIEFQRLMRSENTLPLPGEEVRHRFLFGHFCPGTHRFPSGNGSERECGSLRPSRRPFPAMPDENIDNFGVFATAVPPPYNVWANSP
jgi:hypothetical protein